MLNKDLENLREDLIGELGAISIPKSTSGLVF